MSEIFDKETIQQVTALSRKSDFVYDAIRKAIVYQRIQRGSWLREGALSEQLGVSRTMVRDALIRLTAEGLAEEVPYKGVKAASVSPAEIEEVFTIRAVLESLAFEYAAKCISEEELKQMEDILPETIPYADLEDFEKPRAKNREFHWVAIRATKKRHLIRMLEQIWEFIPTYIYFGKLAEEERRLLAENELMMHRQILDALREGNCPLAGEITKRHILETGTVKHAYQYAVAAEEEE